MGSGGSAPNWDERAESRWAKKQRFFCFVLWWGQHISCTKKQSTAKQSWKHSWSTGNADWQSSQQSKIMFWRQEQHSCCNSHSQTWLLRRCLATTNTGGTDTERTLADVHAGTSWLEILPVLCCFPNIKQMGWKAKGKAKMATSQCCIPDGPPVPGATQRRGAGTSVAKVSSFSSAHTDGNVVPCLRIWLIRWPRVI